MSLNWKEIDTILDELKLPGALIQKIRQPNYHSLLIDLYSPEGGRFPLLIELSPGACRLHSLSKGIPANKAGKLQRFAQLLRSRIQGGRILEARQLGRERIVVLTISGEEGLTNLALRLWSNAANIIAADDEGTIIDAFYRRPGKGELSGRRFDLTVPERSESGNPRHSRLRPAYDEASELTFNAFIESQYETETSEQVLGRLLEETRERAGTHRQRLTASLRKKEQELSELSSYEQILHTADLLSANRHLIESGSSWAEVPDYEDDMRPVNVELDPTRSVTENIERYYTRYHKAKGSCEHLRDEVKQVEREIAQLDQELGRIEAAGGDPGKQLALVKALRKRLAPGGGSSEEASRTPGLRFVSGQFTLLVGRNSRENDKLLRSHTRGNDYWLHTRDYPGGYVFIKYLPGKSVPLETLLDAGNLALYYSKARGGGRADLYYTQVKHLRRAKQAKTGTVLPTHEKNITIELDRSRLDRLFEGENHD